MRIDGTRPSAPSSTWSTLALMTNLLLVARLPAAGGRPADHRPGALLAAAGAGRAAVRARHCARRSRCSPRSAPSATTPVAAHVRPRPGAPRCAGPPRSARSPPRRWSCSASTPRAAWGHPIGAAAIPVLVTAMVLVIATSLLGAGGPRRAADASGCATRCAPASTWRVRRWYLTAVLAGRARAAATALVASRPAIALGLAAAPLLYVVWANSRFTLRAALATAAASASATS